MAFEYPSVLAGVGVALVTAGVLIRYFRWLDLVAGYDPERVDDEEGLANFVGTHVVAVGALTVLVGVVDSLQLVAGPEWYLLAYLAAVLAIVVRIKRGSSRFETATESGSDA